MNLKPTVGDLKGSLLYQRTGKEGVDYTQLMSSQLTSQASTKNQSQINSNRRQIAKDLSSASPNFLLDGGVLSKKDLLLGAGGASGTLTNKGGYSKAIADQMSAQAGFMGSNPKVLHNDQSDFVISAPKNVIHLSGNVNLKNSPSMPLMFVRNSSDGGLKQLQSHGGDYRPPHAIMSQMQAYESAASVEKGAPS